MNEIFTFAGLINHNHDFIIGFHVVLIGVIALLLARLATYRLQVVPNAIQNVFEILLEGILSMAKDVIGEEKARKYLPLTATIAILVFLGNAIGIIPGFESPTSSLNFTVTLAVIVFVFYNFEGIKAHGFIKYFAHFAGPVKALAPLLFPIEVVSHFSRIISLSFRLFGNIKGDDMFLLVMLMLAPWLAPIPAFVILTFMAFLQAFIFMILTYVFLAGAVLADEEHAA